MSNCLVTKLKGAVDNDNLPYFEGLVLSVLPNPGDYDLNKDYSIKLYGVSHIKIIGTGSVYLINENVTVTSEYDIVNPLVYMKCAPGNYKVLLTSKYDIYDIGYYSGATKPYGRGIKFDISDLNYSNVVSIMLSPDSVTGEYVCKVQGNKDIISVLFDPNVYNVKASYKVNIGSLINCPNLEALNVRDSYSYGSITNLIDSISLTSINIPNTKVNGDLKVLLDGQVAKGRTTGTLNVSFLNANLTYNGLPLRTADDAQTAIGIHSYSINVTFDSSAPDGYTIAAA